MGGKSGLRHWFVWLTLILVSAGCTNPSMSVLDPAGPVGREQLKLIYLSTGIMTLVVLVVAVLYIYIVIRYRERPGQEGEIPEQVEGNKKLEVLWTVVPIILLVILAVPTIATTFNINEKPDPAESIRVNVIGYQYWWGFEYPEFGVNTANEVHIPTGKKIEFILRAHDVIHAFWVPSLGGKEDLNPERNTRLVLQADKPGIYEGKCAELCGAAHALMNFRVIAHPPEEFNEWIASQKSPDSTPQSDRGREGQRLVGQNCIGCHAVENAGYPVQGSTGPTLNAFSKRTRIAGVIDNNRENLTTWMVDPQGVKPGNRMPAFDHLTEEQIDAIVQYLLELK
ncbi:cytochrome c oxidase subunit II [Desmospora profundinema]|uniref:Cytochrome c oxidase subunit 2 n=1 Tax=Desmospora profundinema TaxID=1571184 RepID=A0ABU1IM79_9BACL|nr:cytochrome c oxidase subunit II [Desmospora profundinema]MDR6225848.1 cytochrome c oxidase subunit 2 [Desmospora profundinema]